MAGGPTPDNSPALANPLQAALQNLENGKPGPNKPQDRVDNKLAPDAVAANQELIEERNKRIRAEKELAEAKALMQKDTAKRESAVQKAPQVDVFDSEARLQRTRMVESVLGRTLTKFLRKRVEPGPHTNLGMNPEIRQPGWLRRTFARIPLLGLLAPAGMSNVMELHAADIPGFYKRMTDLASVAGAAKEITLASVSPALGVGMLGGLTRGAVDGIRWATMKEKTMHLFARELVNRATDGRKTWDQSAVWNTVMGNRADLKQLIDLGSEFKTGLTADELGMDKKVMWNLIERGFRAKLEKATLERIVDAEGLAKLNPDEKLHFQDIEEAYRVAETMFDQGFTPAEKAYFLEERLPRYLDRAEVTNHISAIAKRTLISGFKTSLVGMAASLFGTLQKTGMFADWGTRIGNVVGKGVANIKDITGQWIDGAKTWLSKVGGIQIAPDPTTSVVNQVASQTTVPTLNVPPDATSGPLPGDKHFSK